MYTAKNHEMQTYRCSFQTHVLQQPDFSQHGCCSGFKTVLHLRCRDGSVADDGKDPLLFRLTKVR